MKYLIVNADDYGASPGVSRGILEAHERGILTSASLLVNTSASETAAVMARATPGLSLGLHADLTAEMNSPAPDLEARLALALKSQWQRFERLMGRAPTHLDSHHNLHRDPRAQPLFLQLAHAHGVPLREHSPVRYFSNFYGQWAGETHPEQISPDGLARLLRSAISEGITELACHPGYVERDFATSYAVERELELKTLCDPSIRRVLEDERIQLVNYQLLTPLLKPAEATASLCPP